MKVNEFIKSIGVASCFSDKGYSRAINNVLIDASDSKVEVTATNGFCMYVKTLDANNQLGNKRCILSLDDCKHLQQITKTDALESVEVSKGSMIITGKENLYDIEGIDEIYPPYKETFPKEQATQIYDVSRLDLIAKLELIGKELGRVQPRLRAGSKRCHLVLRDGRIDFTGHILDVDEEKTKHVLATSDKCRLLSGVIDIQTMLLSYIVIGPLIKALKSESSAEVTFSVWENNGRYKLGMVEDFEGKMKYLTTNIYNDGAYRR